MSKYFLIASAVLLLGTVGLNVLTKGKLTAQAEQLKAANDKAAAAQDASAKAQKARKDAETKASEATAKVQDLQSQMDAVAKARDEAAQKASNVDAAIKAKDDKIAELNRIIEFSGKSNVTPPPAGNVAEELDRVTKERDELKVVKDSLDNKVKGLEGQVAQAERERALRAADAMRPGLRGQVLAVDRNWNFVVLSLGDRNGVNPRATMIVTRGGSLVGKVRITSVEPSQSIADIVPNSVPPGVSVQAGDTVVYQ